VFCKSCGHEIDIDSIYCAFCGVKQPESLKPQQAAPPFAVQPTNKNIEFTAPPVQPLAQPINSEIRKQSTLQTENAVPNNQSLVSENILDDIDLIHKSLHRPETVNISVFLQAAVIIYDLTSIVLGMQANTISGFQIFSILFFSIWRGLLANSIFHRKKRARNIYAILASLRIGLVFFVLDLNTSANLGLKVEYLIVVTTGITAAILLFTKKTTNWFNANSENIL
jgi:hypothetical protein